MSQPQDRGTNPETDARALLAFLDAMVPVFDVVERTGALLRRKLGTAFRIADYTVGGYEVPLNRILGDLLHPRGPHGHGGTFLKLFLEAAASDLPAGDPEKWSVVPSHRTRQGRYVDLALFRHPHIAVYIECKPWAGEGDQQLEDYADDLLRLDHDHKRLLFLPGTADREAQSLTIEARQRLRLGNSGFTILPFQHSGDGPSIVQWLARCAGACDAPNVRLFISDLVDYLNAQFSSNVGGQSMNDDPFAAVMDSIRKDRNYMHLVLRFEGMAYEIKRDVARAFLRDLTHELEVRKTLVGWVVDNHYFDFDSPWQELSLRRESWPIDWRVGMQMDRANFLNFRIGFACPSKPRHLPQLRDPKSPLATDSDRAQILSAMERHLVAIGRLVRKDAHWWPAYCYLPDPFRDWVPETFLLLGGLEQMPEQQSAIDAFANWFEILANAVGNTVDKILLQHA